MSPTEARSAAAQAGRVRLGDLLDRGDPLGLATIAHVGCAIARALAEAHAAVDAEGDPAPDVHGRVGPRAVWITRDGEVALAPRTEAEEPAGTYLAPEIAAGGRPTTRSDVLALARLVKALAADRALPAEIEGALARALDPSPARRKITCVELEAWLGTLGDAGAGRRDLADRVAAARARDPSTSRPLSLLGSALVAAATAAAVIAAGELAIRLARK